MRLAEGLLVAHLCLGAAYLIGSNAIVGTTRADRSAPEAMIRLVCACALGFASIGFGAFLLALVGLFSTGYALLMLVALFFGGCAIARATPFNGEFWRSRWLPIVQSCDVTHVALYYVMIVLAVPAVNQSQIGADAISYHWAYAVDWIQHSGIVVDPFLRIPFFAHNVLLIDALLMMWGAALFVPFLMWSMSLITALGVCSGARMALAGAISAPWASVVGSALSFAVIASPTYLRWMDTGYLDPAYGMFALTSVLALRLALDAGRGRRWLMVSAALAAFLIGSKGSFLALLPVFALAYGIAAHYLKLGWRRTLPVLGVLVALGIPWYLRNLVVAGDPIAPVLNLAIYGRDGLNTAVDAHNILQDIGTDHSLRGMLALPFQIFLHPDTRHLLEYQNALALLLYVPALVLLVRKFIFLRRTPAGIALPVFIVTCMIGYWWSSASLLRYAILFFPTLALCLSYVGALIPIRPVLAGPILAILSALTLVVTPGGQASQFLRQYWSASIATLPSTYTDDEYARRTFVEGYSEEEFTSRLLREKAVGGRLYTIAPDLNYFFRMRGITSIGDWTGPAGYFLLYRAADARRAAEFMNDLDVRAVLIDPTKGIEAFAVPIGRQLVADGFCRLSVPHSRMVLYVRPTSTCARTFGNAAT